VRYYPGIILTYLKGIAKQFNRDIQCTSWDLKWAPPEYKAVALDEPAQSV
jgi:hypothetical protein